jgi:hypothetical protein
MQYEPPAINFPVRKESPQELREGEAAWSCRVALGPGSRSRVIVVDHRYSRALAWPGHETGARRWGKPASNRAIGGKAGRRSHAIDHGWNARVCPASPAPRTIMLNRVSNRGADECPRIQPHHRSATGCRP